MTSNQKRTVRRGLFPFPAAVLVPLAVVAVGATAPSAAIAGGGGLLFHKVALTGEQVPGTEPGVIFLTFTTGLNHDIMRPKIDDQGRVAFIALLTGSGVDATNQSGIWSDATGGLSLVVRTGMQAPGTPDGVTFFGVPSDYLPFPPSFAGGQAAFQGALTGPGIDSGNDDGVWAEQSGIIALIAREDDPAPGLPAGVTFSTVGGGIDNNGHLGLSGSVSGPGVSSSNNDGIWSTRSGVLELLVREGDPAPGTEPGVVFAGGGIGAGPYPLYPAQFNSLSQLAVQGNLAGPGVDVYSDEALFVERNGQLTLLLREGDPAPGADSGVTFGGNSVSLALDSFSFNDLGQVAFHCRLGGSLPTTTAVFSDHNGSLDLIILPGDPAPGADFDFNLFSTPVLSDAGRFAVRAAGPDDDGDPFTQPPFGIWWDQPGTLTPLVLPGDQVYDGQTNVTITSAGAFIGFSSAGDLAFRASLDHPETGYKHGLVLTGPDGDLSLVVATGDLFDVHGDGTDSREVLRIVPGGLSETGAVVFRLDFTDGSSGHFTASIDAGAPLGDFDGDGDVDLDDYTGFNGCLTGPLGEVLPGCEFGDFDQDNDVDLLDFSGFSGVF